MYELKVIGQILNLEGETGLVCLLKDIMSKSIANHYFDLFNVKIQQHKPNIFSKQGFCDLPTPPD